MAANQQLTDYINQQLGIGATREIIKASLLNVGWKEADIDAAMGSTSGNTRAIPSVTSPSSAPMRDIAVAQGVQSAGLKASDVRGAVAAAANAKPATPSLGVVSLGKPTLPSSASVPPMGQAVGKQPSSSPVSAKMNPAGGIRASSETIAKPKTIAEVTAATATNASSSRASSSSAPSKKAPLVPILLGMAALVFLGLSALFYFKSSGSDAEIAQLTATNQTLSAQVADLMQKNADLQKKSIELNDVSAQLMGELGLFMKVPAGAKEQVATLRGAVSESDGKPPFTVTTQSGLRIVIANSSDPGVMALLKPALGASVQISVVPGGTIVPGFVGGALLRAVNGVTVADTNARLESAASATAKTSSTAANASTTKP